MWFAANNGIGTVCHSNPVDAATIGPLVERERVTLMIATPTFLQVYLRRCSPGQFGSLRLVLTGAEKLPPAAADAFEDIFGLRPFEGYGTTECSPAVAIGTAPYRAPGFFQAGSKRGSIGQPLPGVAVCIVDPDTFDPLTTGEPGMLLVRGPNVMKGYLGQPELTARVMHDGWYITGDIATIDEDGYIRITDRLSRFSKIGGEMVPHGNVEEALHQAAGEADRQVFCVVGLPDPRKGERLSVVHTLDESELSAILEALRETGLPNLFIPREDQFVRVDEIPILGTGKIDLKGVKKLAGG
jgi:acyl-[acyl-carrier-protein]-phospholipid O-acyltransferase/long-chain-fatty-acid--[acyl-carrier-protein] ligase